MIKHSGFDKCTVKSRVTEPCTICTAMKASDKTAKLANKFPINYYVWYVVCGKAQSIVW